MDGGEQQQPVGGRYEPIPGGRAFVPNALPPRITYTAVIDDEELGHKVERAMMEIGGLNMAGDLIGEAFVRFVPYLAREAVESSKIEGTNTTLSELLKRRVLAGKARDDNEAMMAKEVENNARALEETMALVSDGAPIDLDIIRRAHRILFDGLPQYRAIEPGEFRTIQNWIGGDGVADATYVPPPPSMVMPLMENLINYIDAGKGPISSLVRCAIAHYQFESIHPFPDGNGRVGRILILLMMKKYGLLNTPVLNISRYLLDHRPRYYDMLRAPRKPGGWVQWIAFFVDACATQAKTGITYMRKLDSLYQEYRKRIEVITRSANAICVIDRIMANPYVTISSVQEATGMKHAGSLYLVHNLVKGDILKPVPTSTRAHLYVAPEVMRILMQRD